MVSSLELAVSGILSVTGLLNRDPFPTVFLKGIYKFCCCAAVDLCVGHQIEVSCYLDVGGWVLMIFMFCTRSETENAVHRD